MKKNSGNILFKGGGRIIFLRSSSFFRFFSVLGRLHS